MRCAQVKQMERTLDIQAGERNEVVRQLENARRTIAAVQAGGAAVDMEAAEPPMSRNGSRPDTAGTHLTSAPNSAQVHDAPCCTRAMTRRTSGQLEGLVMD